MTVCVIPLLGLDKIINPGYHSLRLGTCQGRDDLAGLHEGEGGKPVHVAETGSIFINRQIHDIEAETSAGCCAENGILVE